MSQDGSEMDLVPVSLAVVNGQLARMEVKDKLLRGAQYEEIPTLGSTVVLNLHMKILRSYVGWYSSGVDRLKYQGALQTDQDGSRLAR